MKNMRLLPLLVLSVFVCVSCGTAGRNPVPLASEVVVKAGGEKMVYDICSQPDELPFINFQKGTTVAIDYYPDGGVWILEEHLKLGDHLKQALKQRGMKIVHNADKADVVISIARVGSLKTGEKVKKSTKNSYTWISRNEYSATISVYDRKSETVDRYAYKRPYVQEIMLLLKPTEYQFSFHPTNEELWKELSWNKEPKFESSSSEKKLNAHHVAIREKLKKIVMRLLVKNPEKSPVFDKGDTMAIWYRDERVPGTKRCTSIKEDDVGSEFAVHVLKVLKKERVSVCENMDEGTLLLNIPLFEVGFDQARLEKNGFDLVWDYNGTRLLRLIDQKNGCHLDCELKKHFELVVKGILVEKGKWNHLKK